MFMAIDRHEANLFFQLINKLYGQSSIIITSNKGPEDWGEMLGDPAITTAILDRLLHKSEDGTTVECLGCLTQTKSITMNNIVSAYYPQNSDHLS